MPSTVLADEDIWWNKHCPCPQWTYHLAGRTDDSQMLTHNTVPSGIITMNEAVSVHCKAISLTWLMRNTFLEEVAQELTAEWWSRSYPGTRGRKAIHQREQDVLKGRCQNPFIAGVSKLWSLGHLFLFYWHTATPMCLWLLLCLTRKLQWRSYGL